jgi:hypothetical protein
VIASPLSGNIGDHIVRYLVCRSVAEKNGYSWGINPVTSHDYYHGAEQMDFFNINYGLPNHSAWGEIPLGINNVWEEKYVDNGDHTFHPFQPDIFDIPDNTQLILRCCHDARYYDKEKVRQWLKIKDEKVAECECTLKQYNIELNDDLCVINCRGGEYVGIANLFLRWEYWQQAMNHMLEINPKMKFLVVTEDPHYFKYVFNLPIAHFSICGDYYVVNHAKYLITSNSGFGVFPTWLNENAKFIISPKWWARHNSSNGSWANSDIWTFSKGMNWRWMDREGKLFDYDQMNKENG